MEKEENLYSEFIKSNIRKIMNDKGLTQSAMATMLNKAESQISKILNGKAKLTLDHLSSFAKCLSVTEIDILAYPKTYIEKDKKDDPIKAILQIELQAQKKDAVMKLIFGEHNLEILDK